MTLDRSASLYARAEALIPAGVSSPVRAFRKVGGTPVFFREAQGAYAVGPHIGAPVPGTIGGGPSGAIG